MKKLKYFAGGDSDRASKTRCADWSRFASCDSDAGDVSDDNGSDSGRYRCRRSGGGGYDSRASCGRCWGRSGSWEEEAHLRVLIGIGEQRDGRQVFEWRRSGRCGRRHWHWVAADADLTSETVLALLHSRQENHHNESIIYLFFLFLILKENGERPKKKKGKMRSHNSSRKNRAKGKREEKRVVWDPSRWKLWMFRFVISMEVEEEDENGKTKDAFAWWWWFFVVVVVVYIFIIYRFKVGVGLTRSSAADWSSHTLLDGRAGNVHRTRLCSGRWCYCRRRRLSGGWQSCRRDWVTADTDLAAESVLALLKIEFMLNVNFKISKC